MSTTPTGIHYMPICNDCVNAKGSECHTAECALWLHTVPDYPLNFVMALDQAAVEVVQAIQAMIEPRFEALHESIATLQGTVYDDD